MLGGDAEAFERFFDTAYPVLYRFALARLPCHREAAGDVAQAAICKAIGALHTFRGEAALLTWLCTFCRHELYAWDKQHGRGQHVELLEDDPEVRAALESLRATEHPDTTIDRDKLASAVQAVLDHLPPHYAHALDGNTSTS